MKLTEMLKDAKANGFTLTGEDFEWVIEAVEKAEKYDKIVKCPECKYYYAPVCAFYKILPMTSRKGFCHHGIKGKYHGKTPVIKRFDDVVNTETHIEFSKYMNSPEDENEQEKI